MLAKRRLFAKSGTALHTTVRFATSVHETRVATRVETHQVPRHILDSSVRYPAAAFCRVYVPLRRRRRRRRRRNTTVARGSSSENDSGRVQRERAAHARGRRSITHVQLGRTAEREGACALAITAARLRAEPIESINVNTARLLSSIVAIYIGQSEI